MAKKTPADWKKEGEKLKGILAAAKKKPQNFGLVELAEGMCLEAHALHPVNKLALAAKKADGAKKANCVTGSFEVNGKLMVFNCLEDKLPGGMDVKFKQFLKKADHGAWKAKFIVKGEDQNGGGTAPEPQDDGAPKRPQVQEEPVGEDPKTVKGEEEAPKDGKKRDVPSKEQLATDLKHMTEIFKLSFESMSPEDAKEIKAALKAIAAAISSGDLVSAQNMSNKLTMVTGVNGSSPMEPISYVSQTSDKKGKSSGRGGDDAKRKKELKKSFDGLKPDLRDAVAKAEGAEKAEIGKLVKGFDKNLKAGKLDEAEENLNALKTKLSGGQEAKTGGGEDEDDDSLLDDISDFVGTVKDKIDEKIEETKEDFEEFVEDVKEGVEDVVTDVKDAFGILSEEDEKRQEKLKALNVPEGRQMALIKLARDNPKTYDSAVKALTSLEKTHKDVDVSPQGVSNAVKAVADAQVEQDTALKAWQDANKETKEKQKELDEKKKAEKDEQAKVDAAQKALDEFQAKVPEDLSTLSKTERDKMAAESEKLINALGDAKKLLKTASDATKAAQGAYDTAAADKQAKANVWFAKRDATNAAKAHEAKLQEKKSLLDALSFGPLSANAKKPMDDASVAKFVDAYTKDPKTASAAVKLAGQVEDPKLIADNVGMMCDKVADGFADKDGKKLKATTEELQLMAENALKNGARMGPEYFKNFEKYLESGKQLEPDDCAPTGMKEGSEEFKKKLALNRAGKMSDALIGEDGKVDPDSKEAKEAMEHMMFHPGSLKQPAPAMTDSMSKLMDDFRDPKKGPEMQGVLDGIKEPTKCLSAHSLVAATIGKEGSAVDAKDIKKSVMSAMLTPLAQGPVGSCFSTGPARAVREQDPVKAMKDMTNIATTGIYKPAKGDPIPAIMGLPKGENPLMRSYEYSIATAGAELEDSRENQNLRKGLFNSASGETSLNDLKDIVGSTKWNNEVQGKVQEAVEDGLVFRYNAGPKVGDGSGDGSSTHGRFEILDASTKKPILKKEDFQKIIGKIAVDACGFEKGSDEEAKVLELVGKQAFIDTILKAYNKGDGDKYAPWSMQSGGFARTSTEALRGGDPNSKSWMSEGDGKPENEGKRTKEVLSKFISGTSGEKSEMISLSTNGREDEGANHAFNGLPNHPSLDKIKPPNTDKKIEEELLKPGKEMASTELPTAQAAAMYDEMVKDILDSYRNEDRKAVADALSGKRPSESMTAGELKKHVNDLLEDFKKKKLEEDMEAWEKEKKKELKVDTLPASLVSKRKALLEKNIASKINKNVDKELIKNFDPPEVVVADTNWGGDDSHVYFVIAPDPASGELKMWRKDKFSGEMSPAGDNWINSTWYELDGVPPVGS